MDLPLSRIEDLDEQVYAGVLGKLVGVYLGRPFEGWSRAAIQARLLSPAGRDIVDRYVHEDLERPLVVADDDISGTLTFVRALADSGSGLDTPAAFFGDTWLNYLMEGRTVLWWGGRGMSTEHTAFLNLSEGVPAPDSGSAARNGRTVAEQIGAQIFIDSIGWVIPGRPTLAADVARRAASVSHDGEAVHAAAAVAAMTSAAFAEKRLERLLDIGAAALPEGSLTARLHRDVRAWAARDDDWRRTFARIEKRYGYDRYGGNCHVIPNHAIMVLAWARAAHEAGRRRPSFRRALGIAAACGWDTDCNAGNVAALMGLVVGRHGIDAEYDFTGPIADRIVLPTAEGCRAATDAATEARRLADLGRELAGARVPRRKPGVLHDFALGGARHGWAPESGRLEERDTVRLTWVGDDGGGLAADVHDLFGDRVARLSTPLLPGGAGARYGGARQLQAIGRLSPGTTVTLRGHADTEGPAEAVLFLRVAGEENTSVILSPPRRLRLGRAFRLRLEIPDLGGWPAVDLGLELRAAAGVGSRVSGRVRLHEVAVSGRARIHLDERLPLTDDGAVCGWVCDADLVRNQPFSDDAEPVFRIGRNRGRGVLVTGDDTWDRTDLRARVSLHSGGAAGVLAHYGGLQRYVALLYRPGSVQLLERCYTERLLAELPATWAPDELHDLRLLCRGSTLRATCDGRPLLPVGPAAPPSGGRAARGGKAAPSSPPVLRTRLRAGGAGFLVEAGLAGFRDVTIAQGA